MTEQDQNFNFCVLQNVCRVCLGTNDLRPMRAEEILWHQIIINEMKADTENKLKICLICGHLLKKYMDFYQYCRYTQDLLTITLNKDAKVDNYHTSRPLHNFTKINTTTSYIDTGIDSGDLFLDTKDTYDITFDASTNDDYGISDRDDDLPLVMLSRSNDCVKEDCKKKKKRIKIKTNKSANTVKIKTRKDGFSSRMVQETDEYIVLKLTKEQVIEELRERSQGEKYQRALYKCTLCVQGFNFEDVLAAHMGKHSKENGSFECEMCHQYCPSAVSLRGHIKSHTTRYKCKICGAVRRGRQHLLEHHALTHTHDAQKYSCHHCEFTTNKRTVIQRHVRTHRASERHACHECGRLFHTVESLRVHTTRHDKSRSLRCEECDRGFLYPSLLARHRASVHQSTEYYCVECDVRFKSPDNLRLHFKKAKRHRDSSSYTYECSQCSEKFVSAASLAVHSSTLHGQPKRYACELCRRLYSSRESLRAHMRRAHKHVTDTDQNCT